MKITSYSIGGALIAPAAAPVVNATLLPSYQITLVSFDIGLTFAAKGYLKYQIYIGE